MMLSRRLSLLLFVITAPVGLLPPQASAQPLGTFRWQLLPYCNVVTLNVIAQGVVLTSTDRAISIPARPSFASRSS